MAIFTAAMLLLGALSVIGCFPRYTGAWLYTFCMPIGVCYAWAKSKSVEWNKWMKVILVGLLLWPIAEKNVILYTGFVTTIAMTVIIWPNLSISKCNCKPLKWIGENSYFIYLCEAVVMDSTAVVFSQMNKYIRDSVIIMIIISLVSAKQSLTRLLNRIVREKNEC